MLKNCNHKAIESTQICPTCPRPVDWWQSAKCLDHDPEIWFSPEDEKDTMKQAIRICLTCPVRGYCLEIGWNDKFGIWGSFSSSDRQMLKKVFKLSEDETQKRQIIRTIAHRL
jgi:hypothetical protein